MSVTEGFEEREDPDDATVVRPAAGTMPEDEPEVDDATVVRAAPAPDPAPDLDDATIVRPVPEASDETVVRTRRHAAEAGDAGDETAVRARPGVTASVALPVDDPTASARSIGVTTLPALDPERRITAVPGRAPWEPELEPERGVRPGAPVVYGARSEFRGDPRLGPDLLHQRLGDAPAAAPVLVREQRAALPSMERRARRARIATLVGYGAAVLVAAGGLWLIADLAFG